MSEIFYSQVDPNLQLELNARGRSGKFSRTTADLQFMLEKIANVTIIPYTDAERKKQITEAILGGTTVRSGEYLPSGPNGFLSDRKYEFTESGFEGDKIVQKTKEQRTNTSRRIPPFITSMDVSIGDHSMGLLNSATINITIPNPERDLNFIESVYFRPGRHVTMLIQHPNSAVLSNAETSGELTDEVLPSTKKLESLNPNYTLTDIKQFKKLNSFRFEGLIQSFTFDYQADMSVVATLSMIGTSNIYTDVSLLINSEEKITDAEKQATINQSNSNEIITEELPSFYSNLNREVQEVIEFEERNVPRSDAEKRGYTSKFNSIYEIQTSNAYAIWGTPAPGVDYKRYITLAWLVDYINRVIVSKMKSNSPAATIVFTEISNLCVSNYYPDIVSSDPFRIFFPDLRNRTYGSLKWMADSGIENSDIFFSNVITTSTGADEDVIITNGILINMEVIQEIVKSLEDQKNFTVSALLDQVSKEVYYASGGAFDLKLITHPENTAFLLWYDSNKIKFNSTTVTPYSVPMFSNHPNGTVIRDFKFSGKLPSDASALAYVTNQNPGELAESDIAPFVSYMYAANSVERTGPHESVGTLITQDELKKINDNYRSTHEKYKKQLVDTKKAFGDSITNTEKQAELAQSLQKYIQYPTPTIVNTNSIAAPVIPFDVEFTIDGINGFRYGDVLTFDAIPDRYKRNAVFSIINITHTVATDGQWTTTVRCIMRPKIEA